MAGSVAQLNSSGNIKDDADRLWKHKPASLELHNTHSDLINKVIEYKGYTSELWWLIQRLNFRITELEHPEWYAVTRTIRGR